MLNFSRSDVLQKRPSTPTLKIHTISYLKDRTRSFEYTLDVMRTLEIQTKAEIARLGGNAGLKVIMDLLHVPEVDSRT
jgi:geranylgeranyl diphosphate synthase type 3